MKPLAKFLAAAMMAGALTTSAGAQQQHVLDFDDLSDCAGGALGTYQSWIALLNGVTCQNSGSTTWPTAYSAPNYAFTSTGLIGWSFLPGGVQFQGFYVTGCGSNFFLELLNGGSVVHSRSLSLGCVPTWLDANYTGQIDQVRLSTTGFGYMAVDDITFLTTPPTNNLTVPPTTDLVNTPAATPEPATMLLVASGLGGLGAIARRRRRQAQASQG